MQHRRVGRVPTSADGREPQSADTEPWVGPLRGGRHDQGLHRSDEVLGLKRLLEERLDAEFIAPTSCLVIASRRQDHDRNRRGPFVAAKRFEHGEPIHDGHHQIQDDEIDGLTLRRGEAPRAVVRDQDLVVLWLQEEPDDLGDHALVFDYEYARHLPRPIVLLTHVAVKALRARPG